MIRANIASTYMSLMQQHVDALRRNIEIHYSDTISAIPDAIKWYPEHQIWGVSGFETEGITADIPGSITGITPYPLSNSVKREITAAMSMNAQIDAILTNNKNVTWIYYTSAQGFIYIAPKVMIKDYHFSQSELQRPFFLQATPERDPNSRQIVTDLYEDSAGQGLMITISSPVTINGKFIGVVSLDLGVDLLKRLSLVESIPGETILIDENGKIVVRKDSFSLDETYPHGKTAEEWRNADDGYFWMGKDVVVGELRLVHRVKLSEYFLIAAKKSILVWSLLVLLAMMYLAGLHYIITQKRSQLDLQESEERFRKIFEQHTAVKLLIDPETGAIIDANFAAEKYYGWPRKMLKKMTISQINTLTPDEIKHAMDNALVHNKNIFEFKHKLSDGRIRDVEVFSSEIDIQGKKILHSIIHDITERKIAQNELKESNERTQALLSALPDIMFVFDRNGVFLDFRIPKGRKLYAPPEIFLNKKITAILPAKLAEITLEKLANVFKNGQVEVFQYDLPIDGENRYFESRVVLKSDKEALLIERDITDQKIMENALRASEERMQLILKNSSDIITTLTAEGIQTYVSPAAEKITGFTAEDLTGKAIAELVHPDDLPNILGVWQEALSQPNMTARIQYRHVHKTLGWVYLEAIGQNLLHEPAVQAVLINVRDISDLKNAEKALKQSLENMDRFFDLNPYSSQIVNLDGYTVKVNSAFEQLFGAAPPPSYSIFNDPLLISLGYQNMLIRSKKGETLVYPEMWYDPHLADSDVASKRVCIKFIIFPLYNQNNEIEYYVVMHEDITARKHAEEERAKLQEQLLQSQKMESVGRLAGGVAHDFNNMLSVIIGHAELLLHKIPQEDRMFNGIKEIENAAKRSADLTRQLLAFARKQTVSPVILDLNKTIANMLTMLRRLMGEDIQLRWLPAEGLHAVKLDPSQIDQILANLCVNARDAITKNGSVTIETKNTVFDENYCAANSGYMPGEYVMIAVSDNGCGMSKEDIEHLFEPFYTTKKLGKGTGLGLATIYGIIKQNNGYINVYSEQGHGTTFKIYFPRFIGKTEESRLIDVQDIRHGNETILLVEDERQLLELTKTMLEALGYNVLTASSPTEAIKIAKAHAKAIALVVTDVVMPEMNGRDLADTLTKINPRFKWLFMSGYTADVIAHHGIVDEDIHFIQKPFSLQQLSLKVHEAMNP